MNSVSERNSLAAKDGLAAQSWLVRELILWRRSFTGAGVIRSLFPDAELPFVRRVISEEYVGTSRKPDLWVQLLFADDSVSKREEVSAKLISYGMSDDGTRPSHHASRVPFRDAARHGIFPSDDAEVEAALLEHFVEGESLGRRNDVVSERTLAFFQTSKAFIARAAVAGVAPPFASSIAIIREDGDGAREVRVLSCERAIELLSSPPFVFSSPSDGRVGTIGNNLIHLQRGQALSVGEQRDIQIKINAKALFDAAPRLERANYGA